MQDGCSRGGGLAKSLLAVVVFPCLFSDYYIQKIEKVDFKTITVFSSFD
jgi:hypothetical protein